MYILPILHFHSEEQPRNNQKKHQIAQNLAQIKNKPTRKLNFISFAFTNKHCPVLFCHNELPLNL